jgi:triacylglycerol lipase
MKKLLILFMAASLLILNACSGAEEIINITEVLEITEAEIDISEVISSYVEDDRIVSEDLNLVYKTVGGADLKFDIFYPTAIKFEKTPLVVGFHGGGWIAGNKSQINYIFAPVIDELRANGYAVATVQYRLALSRIVFPAPFEDCADFIMYIKANSDIYNIDPENIGVLGYSAGAHLAMLTAYAADLDLRYCISFAGPSKLYGDDPANYPRATMMLVETLFGGSYAEREELYMSGSPYFYLDGAEHNNTPLLLAHDRTDAVVPFSQSEMMFEKAAGLGIESELIELRGVAHDIEFASGRMAEREQVMQAVLNFIYKFYKNY